MKIITIFPHDPFYEGIFSHVSVSVHCTFPKNAFVWNAFLSNFWFQHVFKQLLRHIQEKTDLLSCFWFHDSRVTIVTFWPGFESCKHKFISRHITTTYTRSAVCTTKKSKLCEKISRAPYALSLSLSLSLSADADPESFDSYNVVFIFHAV